MKIIFILIFIAGFCLVSNDDYDVKCMSGAKCEQNRDR